MAAGIGSERRTFAGNGGTGHTLTRLSQRDLWSRAPLSELDQQSRHNQQRG